MLWEPFSGDNLVALDMVRSGRGAECTAGSVDVSRLSGVAPQPLMRRPDVSPGAFWDRVWGSRSEQIADSGAPVAGQHGVNARGSCLPSTGTYFGDAAGDGGDHRRDGRVNWNGEPNPESQIRSR